MRSFLALAASGTFQLPPTHDEHFSLMELVTIGEASGYLVHAMNNHLNSIVLQAACIEMETKPPVAINPRTFAARERERRADCGTCTRFTPGRHVQANGSILSRFFEKCFTTNWTWRA